MDSTQIKEQALGHANKYMELYRDDPNFQTALEMLTQYGVTNAKTDAGAVLSGQITDFLEKRKIGLDLIIEELVKNNTDKARLVGAAYHSARKLVLTTYDLSGETLNPLDPLKNLFDSLETPDDSYAANYLESMCGLMSGHDPAMQQRLVSSLNDVLPSLIKEHGAVIGKLKSGNASRINREKEREEKTYRGNLEAFIEFVGLKDGLYEPTLEGFTDYKMANSSNTGNGNGYLPITKDLIIELMNGGNYVPSDVIERIEKIAGPVRGISLDESGQKNIAINIVTGDEAHPNLHSLYYADGTRDPDTRDFFIAFIEKALTRASVVGAHRSNTQASIGTLNKYFK